MELNHLLPRVCCDTGATVCIVDAQTARNMGWRYHRAPINLVLANAGKGKVEGLTEPAWAVFAAGAYDETRVQLQALVMEGTGTIFQLLLGKDVMHKLDMVVRSKRRQLEFQAANGRLCVLPVVSWEFTSHMSVAAARAIQASQGLFGAYLQPELLEIARGPAAPPTELLCGALLCSEPVLLPLSSPPAALDSPAGGSLAYLFMRLPKVMGRPLGGVPVGGL
jgi:hypothetical protein